jgi:argininosuccinate synthase
MTNTINRIVLAYSGGLDTSFCIPYLKEHYKAEIHAVSVDCMGADATENEALIAKARKFGADYAEVLDGLNPMYEKIIQPLIMGNVLKDRTYPLCVGSERFIQALLISEYARSVKADAVAHGSTGAGNDQIRFDVALRTLAPELAIITPIRDEALTRAFTSTYLRERGFEIPQKTTDYSVNKGIWGTTVGGKETTVSDQALPMSVWPELPVWHEMQDTPETIRLSFLKGLPCAINGKPMPAILLLQTLRNLGIKHGIGRGMHLGDTILGFKGRVGFEAPVATLIYAAHRELEKLVLTQAQRHIKDQLADQYGLLLHEGKYFDPVMRDIEAFFQSTQGYVEGEVELYLYRGHALAVSSSSPYSLMNQNVARYGEEAQGWTGTEARAYAKLYSIASQVSWRGEQQPS